VADAALRACALANHPRLEAWVRDRLSEPQSSHALAALLQYVADCSLPAPPELMRWLQSDDQLVVRAAARAALGGDASRYLGLIEQLLEHPDEQTRDAALLASLTWGSANARTVCEQLALDQSSVHRSAMVLYAALGTRAQHQKLATQSLRPAARRATLFALGCSGDVDQIPLLLELTASKDPIEAKLAAQAFASIVGIDLQDDAFVVPIKTAARSSTLPSVENDPEAKAALPTFAEEDLDADLVPPPEDALAEPDSLALVNHWNDVRARFNPAQRYLSGAVFSLETALDNLEQTPARRRHAVAMELCVRSGARFRLNTRLFTAAQRQHLALTEIRLRDT
jgi:uncharacterized protein (TIGR02270 family)